ncbi:Uncharacterised protein [Mycobacteroides abscessus subsp. abscessus]|nr:Uncharacterised protein [Mycobacteroides abscessus subsp. abscessus]SKU03956.1 Uncharacterised protein [Mycobacteroides abscessus subsp. abscessus]
MISDSTMLVANVDMPMMLCTTKKETMPLDTVNSKATVSNISTTHAMER